MSVGGTATPRVEQGKPFGAFPVAAHGLGMLSAVQSAWVTPRPYWMMGSNDSRRYQFTLTDSPVTSSRSIPRFIRLTQGRSTPLGSSVGTEPGRPNADDTGKPISQSCT